MTATPHPTYPNSVIVEALCEIHFELSPEKPWKASFPGAFFKQIQDDYPEMEPIQDAGLRIDLALQRILPTDARVRFRHQEGTKLIQLSQSTFTVNILAPYTGWESMRSTMTDGWQKAERILAPVGITQIGLRYINRIPHRNADESAGYWVKSNDYIPPVVLSSQAGFLLRVQTILNEDDKLNITLGPDLSDSAGEYGATILDIDRISNRKLSVTIEDIHSEMERLHEDVWQVFAQSKTDNLTQLLEGRA